MVPSQNLLYHNYIPADSYSGYFFGSYNNGDDHPMAGHQEESRSNSLNEAIIGSTSRDQQQQQHGHDLDEGWLQLGIGGNINHVDITTTTSSSTSNTTTSTRSSPSTTADLVELDLLNNNNHNSSMLRSTIATQPPFIHQVPSSFTMFPQLRMTDFNALLLLQQQHQSRRHQQQDTLNWSFITSQFATTSLPSSSSYLPRLPYHATPNNPSTDHMSVINPPRRINSGIWLMFQASQTQ